jgi:hypothetical protein
MTEDRKKDWIPIQVSPNIKKERIWLDANGNIVDGPPGRGRTPEILEKKGDE